MKEVERARTVLRRARIEAARGAPIELEKATASGALLERRLAEEQSARLGDLGPLGHGHAEEIGRLAKDTETAADLALLAARREASRRQQVTAQRRTELAEGLAAFAVEVEHMPADRELRAAFQTTRLELEAVKAAAERGDEAAADRDLARAAAGLAEVQSLLGRHYARMGDPRLRRRWQEWVDATLAESREGGSSEMAVIIDKLKRRCFLLAGGRVVRVATAELGRNGLADKIYAGDAATPEGRYRIAEKKEGDETSYHRALALDYPTEPDRREFA
ncbi:MAG TPA: hypothetical protein VMM92_02825, partial [Thermoanaerobaculia bacterium]|nr:hypothetical protein [Thermoanaerobaculia bacterium]